MPRTGLNRWALDKFYTSPHVVNICAELIKSNLVIEEDDLCIEPSAGNGSFIDVIRTLSNRCEFYDLKPEHADIVQQDYLELHVDPLPNQKIHVIGNPPFGRQSSLAIKFIKKACEYCDSVSFILPKSFKKDSLKRHYPPNFHLICDYELPSNAFLVDSKQHDVPCVFQIWVKKHVHRELPQKVMPTKYRFVKKEETPDISFRRVGINAGNMEREIATKSIQSHYFITFDVELDDNLFHKLANIKYICKNNTCGPKSISKQELIEAFNKVIV